MTKFEKAKTPEEMGRLICDFLQDHDSLMNTDFVCQICPWQEYCTFEHNGVVAWLNSKHVEEE